MISNFFKKNDENLIYENSNKTMLAKKLLFKIKTNVTYND